MQTSSVGHYLDCSLLAPQLVDVCCLLTLGTVMAFESWRPQGLVDALSYERGRLSRLQRHQYQDGGLFTILSYSRLTIPHYLYLLSEVIRIV